VEESTDTAREENEDLTDFFDGKEDEDAQKTLHAWKKAQTLHARRTKISQEKNLSLDTRSSLTKGKMGHYSTDLNEGTVTKNTAVLDISGRQTWPKTLPRTPWSWTYIEHRGPGHIEMIQEGIHREHHREMIQEGIHREHHGLKGKT
jgi:hypothetical protein